MPSPFPASNDSFSVPNNPSTTPLSSAGTGSRNHWEHHRDLGDAIVAVEQNASTLTHDHSGTGSRATAKLKQVNTHEEADTDDSSQAKHHTLGFGQYQAAAGNHVHDTRYMRMDGSLAQTITGIKTFDRPTIVDFSNARHNHSTPTTGGLAVVGIIREEKTAGATIGPLVANVVGFSRNFNIPANVRVGGMVWVDYEFTASTLQQLDVRIFMGPTGLSDISGMYESYYTAAIDRWPGIAQPYNGATYGGYWFGAGETLRRVIPVPFQMVATGAARTNQSIYVRSGAGSGNGSIKINTLRSAIQFEVDAGN